MVKKPDRSALALRTAVVVLGMHRSGTSALARIVNFLGAAMPRHLVPASDSNPRGQWESSTLVGLHNDLLAALDSSWDDWRTPGARWKESDAASRFAGPLRIAIDEEFGNSPLIALKDPRICRTLPYWMSILEKSGFRTAPLIIVRNPLEVAESLRERDGISFEKAMLLWLRHNLDAEAETRHLQRNIVTFDALLEDWKLLAVQSAARLGIAWPRQPTDAASDVREFLDLELHNHRATQAELEAHTEVPHWVKVAYRALTLLCDEPRAAEPKRELDHVRRAFAESARIFGVEAFAQTEALKQAMKDLAEANARAADAEALRTSLASARSANTELTQRAQTLEGDLASATKRAEKFEKSSREFEAALATAKEAAQSSGKDADANRTRADEADRKIAALTKDMAALAQQKKQLEETVKLTSVDAVELKKLAQHLSDRTEIIETQLKAQQKKSETSGQQLEEARAKALSMSNEMQAALQSAIAAGKERAAAKDEAHAADARAIKLAAELKVQQEALAVARARLAELEADERAALSEVAALRAELAEAWTETDTKLAELPKHAPPSEGHLGDAVERARRVEEDLRFERLHVQHLERRLGTWIGLASAALRKITRLGRKAPQAQRIAARPRRVAQVAPSGG